MLRGNVTAIRSLSFSPKYHGQFWEDDVFWAQIEQLQLTFVLFPKQFGEMVLIFF